MTPKNPLQPDPNLVMQKIKREFQRWPGMWPATVEYDKEDDTYNIYVHTIWQDEIRELERVTKLRCGMISPLYDQRKAKSSLRISFAREW